MSSHTLQPELESCRVGLGRALAHVPEVSCCAFTDACDGPTFAESTRPNRDPSADETSRRKAAFGPFRPDTQRMIAITTNTSMIVKPLRC